MIAKASISSPKTIWGKVVLFLKERHHVALHVACGDITEVQIEQDKLLVPVKDQMLLTMLTEGRREIENALRWQGVDLKLEIIYQPPEVSKQTQDLQLLAASLEGYLTIH